MGCIWFGAIINNVPVNIQTQFFYGYIFYFFGEMEWLNHMVGIYLTLKEMVKQFAKVITSLYTPKNM